MPSSARRATAPLRAAGRRAAGELVTERALVADEVDEDMEPHRMPTGVAPARRTCTTSQPGTSVSSAASAPQRPAAGPATMSWSVRATAVHPAAAASSTTTLGGLRAVRHRRVGVQVDHRPHATRRPILRHRAATGTAPVPPARVSCPAAGEGRLEVSGERDARTRRDPRSPPSGDRQRDEGRVKEACGVFGGLRPRARRSHTSPSTGSTPCSTAARSPPAWR